MSCLIVLTDCSVPRNFFNSKPGVVLWPWENKTPASQRHRPRVLWFKKNETLESFSVSHLSMWCEKPFSWNARVVISSQPVTIFLKGTNFPCRSYESPVSELCGGAVLPLFDALYSTSSCCWRRSKGLTDVIPLSCQLAWLHFIEMLLVLLLVMCIILKTSLLCTLSTLGENLITFVTDVLIVALLMSCNLKCHCSGTLDVASSYSELLNLWVISEQRGYNRHYRCHLASWNFNFSNFSRSSVKNSLSYK